MHGSRPDLFQLRQLILTAVVITGADRDYRGRRFVFGVRWLLAIRRNGDWHCKNGRWFAAN